MRAKSWASGSCVGGGSLSWVGSWWWEGQMSGTRFVKSQTREERRGDPDERRASCRSSKMKEVHKNHSEVGLSHPMVDHSSLLSST